MKKVIIILLLSLSVLSCSTRIVVQSVETGQVLRINEAHNITKVGDTIVVRSSSGLVGHSFYGMYTGKIPKTTSKQNIFLTYRVYTRIK